jgi:hypothetical protein
MAVRSHPLCYITGHWHASGILDVGSGVRIMKYSEFGEYRMNLDGIVSRKVSYNPDCGYLVVCRIYGDTDAIRARIFDTLFDSDSDNKETVSVVDTCKPVILKEGSMNKYWSK